MNRWYDKNRVHKLCPYVAVLMMYLMTPGSGELTENIVHLVMNGHTAHALDDADHQPEDDEHGCSGPYHVCQCHTSTGFLAGVGDVRLGAAFAAGARLSWGAEDAKADGCLAGVFRPPIA